MGRRWTDAQRLRRESLRDRLAALQSETHELAERYADDPRQLSDALAALYRDHDVPPPWKACLDPQVVVGMLYAVAVYVPALRSPRHQALHDRLARALVIRSR